MDEWIGPKCQAYLEAITSQSPPAQEENRCNSCLHTSGLWRCMDCIGNRPLCRECCRSRHRDLPFHRIEFWKGTHYERDWLSNLGLVIHLGHQGEHCPVRNPVTLLRESEKSTTSWKIYDSPSGFVDKPLDCAAVIVAHTNGIHKVSVRSCSCREGGEEYQFLELGLYPASYTRVNTVFTFDLLDNCRLDNLECKASVYHMWSKLKRLTCRFFPSGVPVSGVPFSDKYSLLMICGPNHRIGIRNFSVHSGNGET